MSEDQNAINPNDDQQTDSSLQNTSIDQPETPPTNMDIHHHPEVEKKGLKEYLLEELMIFLAVSIVFIAESLGENIIDKKKLHGYMMQILENLKFDTSVAAMH